MKRKIRNTVTYLVFLAIGVFLFYLASLDITRGALAIEKNSTRFEVGRGLEKCEQNQRLIRISAATDDLFNTPFSLRADENTQPFYTDVFPNQDEGALEICLPAGWYHIDIESFKSGQTVVLEGIDKTAVLAEDMRKAKIPGIVLSVIFGYLAIVSRGLRWTLMLDPLGHHPGKWRSIHAVAFAYFANIFVPRSGELARCVALNQTDDIPVDRLFGTVISERVVDFVMLASITAIAFATNIEAFTRLLSGRQDGNINTEESSFPWLMIAIVAGVLLLLLLVLRRTIFFKTLINKVRGFLFGVSEGLRSVITMRKKGRFIFYTFFIWGMYFCSTYAIFLSIDATASLPLTSALFIMVAGGFGMVIPAPGGIGSYHWMIKLAFIALGLSGTLGFAVANVLWLTQTVMMIVAGAIGYLFLMWFRVRRDRRILPVNE